MERPETASRPGTRPVISFLTDFGADSAAAICRGVMLSICPDAQIVDIAHSIKKFSIRDGAFLFWCAMPWMPVGATVGVVDPGVGTPRRAIGIKVGRGDVMIGPDNGLLIPAARRLGGIKAVRLLENPAWMLPHQTSTFHGRDLFSPMGAHIAAGGAFEDLGAEVDPASLVDLAFADPVVGDNVLDSSVLYVDSFGNLRLAGDPDDLVRAVGQLEPGRQFVVEFGASNGSAAIAERVPWARTFGERNLGEPLLYEDSFGRLAYADNQSSVAGRLGIGVDRPVRIRPA
jgi:S-adenosyl-L-methionine hydrolase (adenosine-forming)